MSITNQDVSKVRLLQLEELEMLKALRDFCDKREIQYYLAFGTLLGAIRHKGFIPWDDDVDVFMKRNDYNRFLQEAENGLPEWLTIKTYNNTQLGAERFSMQAKVEAKNKYVVRETGGNQQKHRIWIDVFPVDGMPRNPIESYIHYRMIELHSSICRYAQILNNFDKRKQRSLIKRIVIEVADLCKLWKLLPPQKAFDGLDKCLSKYSFESSDYVVGYGYKHKKKDIVQKTCFGDGRKVIFEGEYFWAPEKPDMLLQRWYGDYHKLPPEEKRIPIHCVDIILE